MITQQVLGRERERRKIKWGGSKRHYIWEGGETRYYIFGFEGSQSVPALPSGTGDTHDRNQYL
jgi:hypothetical protein